ncbi:hypothetical protein JAAARDRAFT_37620 [Jaapia argillacea MUCL 33604]|uniref:F-box domain-containing protein n=1 Tax=Jaapia argillacea MUCL 33604 TaxID=933084 RepID=A0A067PMR7_9AGAM|nr:hypothetical protein JAAARDRAFT_37620 [Jaapia argillacea MUCL 33604]
MKRFWKCPISRLRHARTRTRTISQAQESTLPPEVIIMIFQYLSPGSSLLDECISHQGNLASTILVCRTWYHYGVARLYSRPIVYLFAVDLLLRALRRRGDLSSYVRTIVLMIPRLDPRRPKAPSRYVRDFCSILRTVPSIKALALRPLPNPDDPDSRYLPRGAFLGMTLQPHQLQNLRRFVFDGLALSPDSLFHPSDTPAAVVVVLPLLEELSVIHVALANSFVWPTCPSLIRLQLKFCRFVDRNIVFRPPVSALKQIDIDESWSDENDADISVSLYPFASTLEVLHLDTGLFHREIHLVDYTRLTSLKHLSLFLNELSYSSSVPPLPPTVARIPNLESLVITCIWALDSSFSPWSVIEYLISLLRSGKRVFEALRVLVVQGESRVWRAGPGWEERASLLRGICGGRGIDLTLREYSFNEPHRGPPDVHPSCQVLGLEGLLEDC